MHRVFHILAPARHGGLERVVEFLTRGQRARNVDARIIVVLTPDDATKHPFVEMAHGFGLPITAIVVGNRHYVREYRMLQSLFRELRPDVVHTHGYRPDIVAGLAARSVGIPAVSTIHGFTGNGWRNRLNERVQEFALRRADAVIAVSAPLRGRIVAAGVSDARVHVVPNGFMPTRGLVPRDEARARLGLPSSARIAGWLGRLSPEKGPDVMVDAIAASRSDWQVSMVGDGRARSGLEARAAAAGAADRVRWHGMVPEGGSLLLAFDAFVLSSRTEGTPIALLEAMNAGTPIIATRVGGVPEVVREAEAILVDSESPAAIASALDELVSNPKSAQSRAAAARTRVATVYGMDAWLDAIDVAYAAARRR